MKKKLWAVLLTIVTCFCLFFAFAACEIVVKLSDDDSTGTSESSSDTASSEDSSDGTSSEDSSGDVDEETVITEIGDLLESATNNTEASVEGVVFGVTDAGLYVNDGTGSIFVLYTDGGVSAGDSITASDGKFVLKNGQPIINYAEITVNSSGNETLEATEGTVKEVASLDSSSRYSYAAYYTVTGMVSYDAANRYVLTDDGYSVIVETDSNDDAFANYVSATVTADVITYSNSTEGWFVSYVGTEDDIVEQGIDIESIKDDVFSSVASELSTVAYGVLDLPTSYSAEPGLTFTWSVSGDTEAIVIEDNVAEVSRTLTEDEEVTLTLTISSAGAEASYDYTVTVKALNTYDLDDISTTAISESENFYTEGLVLSRGRNQSGSIFVLILMGDTEYMRVDVQSKDMADSADIGDTVRLFACTASYGIEALELEVTGTDADYANDYENMSYSTLSTDSEFEAVANAQFTGTDLYKIESPYMVYSGNTTYNYVRFGASASNAADGYGTSSAKFCFSLDSLEYAGVDDIFDGLEINILKNGATKYYGYTFYAFHVFTGTTNQFILPGSDAIFVDEEEVAEGEILTEVSVTTYDASTEGGTFSLPTSTDSIESITWTSDNTDAITIAEDGTATYSVQDSVQDVTVKLTATYYVNEQLCTTEITITLTVAPIEAISVSEALVAGDGDITAIEGTVVGIASGHGGTLTTYSAEGLYLSDGENIVVLTTLGGNLSMDDYYNYYIDDTALEVGDVICLYYVELSGKAIVCNSGSVGSITSTGSDVSEWSYEAETIIDSEEDLAEYMGNLTTDSGTDSRDYSIVQVVATENNPIYIGATASYFLHFYYLDENEISSTTKADSGYTTGDGETVGYIGSHTYSWLFALGDEWLLTNTPVSSIDTSKNYGATATVTPGSSGTAGTYAFTGSFYFVLEYVGSTKYPYIYCGILAAGFDLTPYTAAE